MIGRWLVRVLAVGITVAIVADTQAAASDEDFAAADALMVRLMSTDSAPGAALALIEGGKIVLERGDGFRDLETQAPVTRRHSSTSAQTRNHSRRLGIA